MSINKANTETETQPATFGAKIKKCLTKFKHLHLFLFFPVIK